MTIFQSIILGIIQGLTEFLPVSSSGHLVIAQSLIKEFKQPGVLFDVTLHLGTLIAVIIYFKDRIIKILKDIKLLSFIILATVPTGIIGILFKDRFEEMFSNVKLVGLMLMVTAVIIFIADRVKSDSKDLSKVNWLNSVIIGIAQGIAIIPGISRSGSTISAGILLGLDKKFAMEFSFLISIPAILGAMVLEVKDLTSEKLQNINYFVYIAGFLMAAIVGYLSIKLLLNLLQKQRLYIFSIYCIVLGLVILGTGL
ncbi:MAG: undecaprenyl-diphosphatase UppP [Candidatus Firestonebacteria bacterium]